MTHLTWADIVGAAVDHQAREADQARLLAHLADYLSDPDARVVSFGDIGRNWTAVFKSIDRPARRPL